MKSFTHFLVGAVSLAAFTFSASAESSVTLSGVHNCCKGCARGIEKAITSTGATAEIDGETVVVKAGSDAEVEKAVSSLLAAGYFGEGATAPEVADKQVTSAEVGDVHLCCGKCVKAVEKAVAACKGASSHTAEKGAKTFTVEGDFSTADLAAALHAVGLNGRIK